MAIEEEPHEENPHAGHGPVVLDIGGNVGALVVIMPKAMDHLEVEIIPSGTDARPQGAIAYSRDGQAPTPVRSHIHDGPEHGQAGLHHAHSAPPHVAVVGRPTPSGAVVHSLVYGALLAGTYDLYVRPHGPVQLTATVVGGQVTEAHWD